MKLPTEYMQDVNYCYADDTVDKKKQTLSALSDWVLENKPKEIEMSEHQFYQFTYLQPLHAGQERYWTTFRGIPIRCYEMTKEQQTNLGLNVL